MEKVSIEELIEEETTRRLEEMQSPDYEFPERAGKADAVGIAAAIGISIILILLCVTGVIL